MFSEEFWSLVEESIELGYIGVQEHPDYPLWIYNYTNQCMFDAHWNEATIQCRGLIVDENKNIVALPFKKFFSDSQLESLGIKIPNEPFEVYDKLDGSLGILYQIPSGEYAIATRGSFTSEQAMEANEIFYDNGYNEYKFNSAYTYLFEIIYPGNRIVIDYGSEKNLYLLAIIDKATGKDIPLPNQSEVPFPIVRRFDGVKDFNEVLNQFKNIPGTQFEGLVIRFQSGVRIKLKTENYKLLHKLFCGLSEKRVWEIISEGGTLEDILKVCPDEFFQYVLNVERKLKTSFNRIENIAKMMFRDAFNYADSLNDELNHRKNFAQYVLKCPTLVYRSVCFSMYSNQDYSNIIWKSLKPIGSKTFRNSGDEE